MGAGILHIYRIAHLSATVQLVYKDVLILLVRFQLSVDLPQARIQETSKSCHQT